VRSGTCGCQNGLFNHHPGFDGSRRVLAEMLEEGLVLSLPPAEAVTEALRREVLRYYPKEAAELKKQERRQNFAWVAERYRVNRRGYAHGLVIGI